MDKNPSGVELFRELWPSLSDAQQGVILRHDLLVARNRLNAAKSRSLTKFEQTCLSEKIADCSEIVIAKAQLKKKQFNLTSTPWGRAHPAISKMEVEAWELRVSQLSKGDLELRNKIKANIMSKGV